MATTRRFKTLAWLVVPALIGAGALYGALARRGHDAPARPSARTTAAANANAPPQVRQAYELARARDPARVIATYAEWAGDPAAFEARKLLLSSLLQEENLPKKLSAVLAAVEADPTPPEQDPLWSHLAEALSELWQGETTTHALDLVIAETRPRARRALISSFAHLASSERLGELTPQQRQTLTETMIDVAPQIPPSQRQEIDLALRRLGGNDLADIVAGKGLTGNDGHELESERAYKASLEETGLELAEEGEPRNGP
jgi:hypothetical protein